MAYKVDYFLPGERFETKQLQAKLDYKALDGSEIRLLPDVNGGGLSHCTLPLKAVSRAVCHKTVEEIWYFIDGRGEVWRKLGDQEETVEATRGTSLTIPVGTHFQFRNTGDVPLRFIIATMPPWPGPDEAVRVEDHWRA